MSDLRHTIAVIFATLIAVLLISSCVLNRIKMFEPSPPAHGKFWNP